MAANRETSSSTGVVFAKAKSEWVIPQRAKPGRKSSKIAVETPVVRRFFFDLLACHCLATHFSHIRNMHLQLPREVETLNERFVNARPNM